MGGELSEGAAVVVRERDDAEVMDVVDRVTREVLPVAMVDRVTMRRDVDHEGDPILAIQILVDTDKGTIGAADVSRLIRRLRTNLVESNEDAFPIISFVTVAEEREEAR